MTRKVLILGGTKEARHFANQLVADGHDVTTSFAGVTQTPTLPEGHVRVGGFGGAAGLRDYLLCENIDVLIDATHPFATAISRNASEATRGLNLLHYRLERPAWDKQHRDRWIEVGDAASAAAILPAGAKVLLTIGRKDLEPFLARKDISGAVRMIELPHEKLPATWDLVRERPPFTLDSELAYLVAGKFTHLVTKNSGSEDTGHKLTAARQMHMPVVMIGRPLKQGGRVFSDLAEIQFKLAQEQATGQ